MKKIALISGAFILLAAASANAQVSVTFGEPVEPVYAAPVYAPGPGYVMAPDWPSEHYDIHRHRHNDYWAAHQHVEHAEHRR